MNRIFGRKKDHRDHMVRNLATSLILYERVDTTAAKAKEVKSFVDQVIARHKTNDLKTIRSLHSIFFDDKAVDKIINELIPRYQAKNSGFILSYHLKNRLGDNSEMIRLELADKKVFIAKDKKQLVGEKETELKTEDKKESTRK